MVITVSNGAFCLSVGCYFDDNVGNMQLLK